MQAFKYFLLFKFATLYKHFCCFNCERHKEVCRVYFNSYAKYEVISEKNAALGSQREEMFILSLYFLCPAQNWVHIGCPGNSKQLKRACWSWSGEPWSLTPELAVSCTSFGSEGQPPKLELVLNHSKSRVPENDMRFWCAKTVKPCNKTQ